MIRTTTVITAAALAGLCTSRGLAATVTYQLTFSATWSTQTHPGLYPAGAHFSSLIGGAHNSAVGFWSPGGQASAGIEQMAEIGGTSALRSEVLTAVNAGSALAVIQRSGLNSPGSTSVTFDVTPEFPLVTLVAMVAPSPDWFVGVHGFDLREGGNWKQQAAVDLYAYDAGTEMGNGFSLSNPDTVPHQPIALLNFPLSTSVPRLGTFTFTRLSATPEPASAGLIAPILFAGLCRRRRTGMKRCGVSVASLLP